MDAALREIPFNYTSADDRLVATFLGGEALWERLEQLRARRVTGRSARLLLRIFGDLFVHRRNAFLYQELLDAPRRRARLLRRLATELAIVESSSGGDPLVLEVLTTTRELLAHFAHELGGAARERRRIVTALAPIVGQQNVLFDPFTLVSHATDATDWRLFCRAWWSRPPARSRSARCCGRSARWDWRRFRAAPARASPAARYPSAPAAR
ncbi:MAG: DUF3683 domain-containing protein [Proteobacteria bacterium]|nr:DUF3683 domain-containing protein [Pseudomonadota bacterium]